MERLKKTYLSFIQAHIDKTFAALDLTDQNVESESLFSRLNYLQDLENLEQQSAKRPLDAWIAVLLCGRLQLRLPRWAVKHFAEATTSYIHGSTNDLSILFGFRASRGVDPEILQRLRGVCCQLLLMDVWIRSLGGHSIKQACQSVILAARNDYQNDTVFAGLKLPSPEGLRRLYYSWRKSSAGHKHMKPLDPVLSAYLLAYLLPLRVPSVED